MPQVYALAERMPDWFRVLVLAAAFTGSMRAVLIYQHATTDRDRSIADALSELVDLGRTEDSAADSKDDDGDDGTAGALAPVA